jgi:hypothetical protein
VIYPAPCEFNAAVTLRGKIKAVVERHTDDLICLCLTSEDDNSELVVWVDDDAQIDAIEWAVAVYKNDRDGDDAQAASAPSGKVCNRCGRAYEGMAQCSCGSRVWRVN